MEVHIYEKIQEKGNVITLHYGPDWWIEPSGSYKIFRQFSVNEKRVLCVKKMPADWVGDTYLGCQTVTLPQRKIYKNISEIPLISHVKGWEGSL